MPKLRNLRVINAQFNDAKGIYQDFRMPFHGYNGTYELVNGGGKSVLLMLLLQCILPNTALDPKRPFKDMFVGGDGNRTTHVLAEWELDDGVSDDKYLLTGFCAKKRSSRDEEVSNAEIQFFNYIHRYSKKNEFDINNINLCWWDNDDFIVQDYTKTRSMLQENTSNYRIQIADKKRDYLELLKNYYLIESEWDLIKSINRRENHIKEYFVNYKKSRGLVEDFLVSTIEECIHDRQRLKIGGNEDVSSKKFLAEALHQSQGDLKRLQQEQNSLRDYEKLLSEVENLNTANARLMEAYQTYEEAKCLAASQYKGYITAINIKDEEIKEISTKIIESQKIHQNLKIYIEKIKLMRFNVDVNLSFKEKEDIENEKISLEETVKDLENSYKFAIAVNKYLQIKDLEAKIRENEGILKNIQEEHQDLFKKITPFGKTLYSNLKNEIESIKQQLKVKKAEYNESQSTIGSLKEKRGSILANIKNNNEQTVSLTKQLLTLKERENELSLKTQSLPQVTSGLFLHDKIHSTIEKIEELKNEHKSANINIDLLKDSISENRSIVSALIEKIKYENETIEKLKEDKKIFLNEKSATIDITKVYGKGDIHSCYSDLQIKIKENNISFQEQNSVLSRLRENLETVEKYGFSLSSEFLNMLTIFTKNYPSVTSGAEYLKNLPEERRNETLNHAPWLSKTILLLGKQFNEIIRDPSSLPTEIQDSQVIIANIDSLREKRNLSMGDIFIPHRSVNHSLDVLNKDRTIKNIQRKIEKQTDIITNLQQSQKNYDDDFSIIRKFIERYSGDYECDLEASISGHTLQKRDHEKSLDAAKQQILIDDESLSKEKNKVQKCLETINLLGSKHEILKELLLIEDKTEDVSKGILNCETRSKELESSLKLVDNQLNIEEFEIQQKSDLIKESEKHTFELEHEIKIYKEYAESNVDILPDYDLQNVRSEFLAIKHVLEEKTGDLYERKERINSDRDRITEYLSDIERSGIKREEIELKKPNNPYSNDYLHRIVSNKKDFEDRLLNEISRFLEAEDRYNGLYIDFKSKINLYNLSADEEYTPLPELFEGTHLDAELVFKIQEEQDVETNINELDKLCQQKEQEKIILNENCAEYKILAGIHGFNTISAPVAEELIDYIHIRDKLEQDVKSIKKYKDSFETKRTQFDHDVTGISVAPTFKDTIKQKLRVADSLREAQSNRQNLEDYSNNIQLKINFTKSQIEPLKEVEKKVVDQALGMAMLYRNYLKKFPEISKIYIDGTLKDMVRMNFDQCIYSDDQAKVEMSRYIQDLSKGIENGTIGLKELENYLRPNQLINKVMDMGIIRVKIRKIDRGSINFQNWEAIKASDGQENTMYIIFIVILMSFIRDIVVGRHDKKTSKVMIIDNPFGSTGAYYLWEPIWSILDRNNVQLICTGHKIGAKVREFFPFNHILTEEPSNSGQIRIGIKVEASGPAREMLDEMQRGTINYWTN